MVPNGRIPNRLKKFRLINGFSQEQVARLMGMKKANLISEWERGTVAPGLDNLLKLSVLYHTLIEELYFDRLQIHRSLMGRVCIINQPVQQKQQKV